LFTIPSTANYEILKTKPITYSDLFLESIKNPITPIIAKPKTSRGFSGNRKLNRELGFLIVKDYGWERYWNCFDRLVMEESGWKEWATNPTSGAYGIGQALPRTKMLSWGDIHDPEVQLSWMVNYVEKRYGNPCTALDYQIKNNWY